MWSTMVQLDWTAIDAVLTTVQRMEDLQPLDTLVPASCCLNWQKVAAAVALTRRFAVISGGPEPVKLRQSPNCSQL